MRRLATKYAQIRGFCAALSCLALAACSGDSASKPPSTAAGSGGTGTTLPGGGGTGAPSAGTTAVGTGGTGAPPGGGRSGAPGTGTGAAGRGTTAGTGTATAGTAAPAAGTGAAGSTGEPTPSGGASVLQYHGNATRDGHYVDPAFTRAAAAMLKKDTTFMGATTGTMQAQPLYVEAGAAGKDIIITATSNNEVTALDAASGAMVWKTPLGPVQSGAGCSLESRTIGVSGTPAIDAATKTLYVAALVSGQKHQVFALGLEDGKVKTGWPAEVNSVTADGVRFNAVGQNQRGALLVLGDMVYVPYGGYNGDCNEYHGWVVGVPLSNPSAPIGFATKAQAGAIWAPGGIASDGTSIYAATGNTMAGPLQGFSFTTPATWGHGNAVLKLGKDLKDIAESDTANFFAVENWKMLDMSDLDLGSTNPVVFTVPGATPSDLAIAIGKEGAAYLLDRAKLGGMGGELQRLVVAPSGITAPVVGSTAAYTTATGTFVAFRTQSGQAMGCGSGSGVVGGIKIEAGSPPTMKVAWCGGPAGNGSPIVTTTDGKTDSIVWYIAGGKLIGLNGESGQMVYGGGGGSDGTGATAKWITPIVAKGRIFVGTNSGVVAYTTK